jgi:hypothetical protein
VLPVAGMSRPAIFGQVTVNETMTARYVAPELRAKLYSIRFTIGFLGAAIASPLVGFLHSGDGEPRARDDRAGRGGGGDAGLRAAFPNRREELNPELWASAPEANAVRPAPAE